MQSFLVIHGAASRGDILNMCISNCSPKSAVYLADAELNARGGSSLVRIAGMLHASLASP